MISRSEPSPTGLRQLVAKPAARAGILLIALWIGSAVILRGSPDFGAMIAILACASAVLWWPETGRRLFFGQLVMWAALLGATAIILWSSPNLWPMFVLFGIAAAWFVIGEPLMRPRHVR